MEPSDDIIEFIGKQEGFRANAYQPIPGDKWTIGYGFTRMDGQPVQKGDTIDKDNALIYLGTVVDNVASLINAKPVPDSVNQNEFDAVVSLVYNIGIGHFTNSNTGVMFYKGEDIADKFEEWAMSQGKVIPGLLARRQKEKEIYVNDNYGE